MSLDERDAYEVNELDQIYLMPGDILRFKQLKGAIKIISIQSRAKQIIGGEVVLKKKKHFFKPDIAPSNQLFEIVNLKSEIKLTESNLKDFKLRVLSYPTFSEIGKGKLVSSDDSSIGPDQSLLDSMLAEAGVLRKRPEYTKGAAEDASIPRQDLRHLDFVTIDGLSAKDFDDAIYATKTSNGFEIYVAIADVANFVKSGSDLDHDAQRRANSFYLPNRAVNMLPAALANDECSLNPRQDRLCLVVQISYNDKATVLKSDVYQGIIQSKARLSYEQLDKGDFSNFNLDSAKISALYQSYLGFSDSLHKEKLKQGALFFEFAEQDFVFDEKNNFTNIEKRQGSKARHLIEMFMIAANEAVGKYCIDHSLPTLWRNHPPPSAEKIRNLKQSFQLWGIKQAQLQEYKKIGYLLENVIKKSPHQELLSTMILRSMTRAGYDFKNQGHYGLGSKHYCHFTSPIRRYSDLFVHQNLKSFWRGQKLNKAKFTLCSHLNDQEKMADKIERHASVVYSEYFLQSKAETEFEAKITQVNPYGITVELVDIFVTGVVPLSLLTGDYFEFDEYRQILVGKRSRLKILPNKRLIVAFNRVDFEHTCLEFLWLRWITPNLIS